MNDRETHKAIWIKELNGYGITEGNNGQPLDQLDYFDIRSLLVIAQMKNDTDINLGKVANGWF